MTTSFGQLTPAQVLEPARQIAQDLLAANAEQIDQMGQWPEQNLKALQAAGLGGMVVPVEHGGLGLGLLSVAQVCEILGRVCSSTALCFGMHCVGTAVIASKATPYQQEQYLGPIARGEHLTTLALSEPGSGAHFFLPQTTLSRTESDTFAVNGTKSFVTNGGHADSYVISTVAAEPDAPPGEFSCIVIPHETEGLIWGSDWGGFGMRGNASRTVELRDVHVPSANLLGEVGDQIWYLFEVVAPYFLMAMGGTYLGIATAAFEEVRTHLSRRRYDVMGTALANQPVIQHRLGTLWATIERTRRLLYYAAQQADSGDPDALLALASAKAEAAELAVTVSNEAMTLTGGIAYRDNTRLARCLRDARAGPIMAPTTDLLRIWTGRALLGIPLLSE